MGVFDSCDLFYGYHTILILVDAPYDNGELKVELDGILQNLLDAVREMACDNRDCTVKTVVLTPPLANGYSFDFPAMADNCIWQKLEIGKTDDLNGFFSQFNSMLSSKCLLPGKKRNLPPVIILLSAKAHSDDYEAGMEELKRNKWFCYSRRVAIDLIDGASGVLMANFTGDKDAVLYPCDMELIKKLLKPTRLIGLLGKIEEDWDW